MKEQESFPHHIHNQQQQLYEPPPMTQDVTPRDGVPSTLEGRKFLFLSINFVLPEGASRSFMSASKQQKKA